MSAQPKLQTETSFSRKSLIVCLLGAIATTAALFLLPWSYLNSAIDQLFGIVWAAIGPSVGWFFSGIWSGLAFIMAGLMYPLFWVGSFMTVYSSASVAVLVCACLCWLCVFLKGGFSSSQTWTKDPIKWQFRIFLSIILYGFMSFYSFLISTSMVSHVMDEQSTYRIDVDTEVVVKPGSGAGFSKILFKDLYKHGVATRYILPEPCRAFAEYGVPNGVLTMTVNGQPADPAACRFGRNTLVWTVRQ